MADRTKIEWTRSPDGTPGATWNPLRGCSRVSDGCRHCYAETVAARFSGPGQPYAGLAKRVTRPDGTSEARWTGKVEFVEHMLDQPLRWKRPRRIFVNSMSDLFHESVPDEWIDQVFAVMALAPRHAFQALTKRPERMRKYVSDIATQGRIARALIDRHLLTGISTFAAGPDWPVCSIGDIDDPDDVALKAWPLPNVWLGTSVEDQARADERIPILLDTPAAIRWISAEPLLSQVDISPWLFGGDPPCPKCPKDIDCDCGWQTRRELGQPHLSWIVVGGESGPGARPFDIEWARILVYQCKTSDVPVFVKQMGSRPIAMKDKGACPEPWPLALDSRSGTDMDEWPEDLRIQEYPAP